MDTIQTRVLLQKDGLRFKFQIREIIFRLEEGYLFYRKRVLQAALISVFIMLMVLRPLL